MEGGSTEIGRQRSEKRRIEQARLCSQSTVRSTGGGGRSTARSTGVHEHAQEAVGGRPACTNMHRKEAVDRPVDRLTRP